MLFFQVRLRTCAQYTSMNEFTCSEQSVRIRTVRIKKRLTGKELIYIHTYIYAHNPTDSRPGALTNVDKSSNSNTE